MTEIPEHQHEFYEEEYPLHCEICGDGASALAEIRYWKQRAENAEARMRATERKVEDANFLAGIVAIGEATAKARVEELEAALREGAAMCHEFVVMAERVSGAEVRVAPQAAVDHTCLECGRTVTACTCDGVHRD